MADVQQALGAVIRSARRRQRLTIKELAERAALSVPYLGEIERGKKYPSAQILERLAQALEVEVAEILEEAAAELRGPTPPRRIEAIGFALAPRAPASPRALVDRIVEVLAPEDVAILGEMGAFLAARRRGDVPPLGGEGL